MTLRHMLDGLMQVTGAPNHSQLGDMIGLDPATVHHMNRGEVKGLNMKTFERVQTMSQVSADRLLEWYRLPPDAVLGRIKKTDQKKRRHRPEYEND